MDARGLPPPANGEQRALHCLRGALSRGPASASHIEEMAAKRRIGSRQLEAAKALLDIRVERRGDGLGIVYLLPSQAADAEAPQA